MAHRVRPIVTAEDHATLRTISRLGGFDPDARYIFVDEEKTAEAVEIAIDYARTNGFPGIPEAGYFNADRKQLNLRLNHNWRETYSLPEVGGLIHNSLALHWRRNYRPTKVEFVDYFDEPYVSENYRHAVLVEAFRRAADPREVRLEWKKQDQLTAIQVLQSMGRLRKVGIAVDREHEQRDRELERLAGAVGVPVWAALLIARFALGRKRNGHIPWPSPEIVAAPAVGGMAVGAV